MNAWYRARAAESLPRALTLADRRPFPIGSGSFHREGWKYVFPSTGFSSPAFQAGCYALARAATAGFPGNPLFGRPGVLETAGAGIDFAERSRNADGSFPEWFPGQRSYCATAYLTYYLSRSFAAAAGAAAPDRAARWKRMLVEAGDWLCGRDNPDSANQVAAAGAALASLHRLLDIPRFRTGAERSWEALRARQHPDGWLPEYGGPDVGYATAALDMAARTLEEVPVPAARETGCAIFRYLENLLYPGAAVPVAALSSRGSGYFLPFGWEWFSRREPAREACRRNFRTMLTGGWVPAPAAVDDRYFLQVFLPSFLDAALLPHPAEDAPAVAHRDAPPGVIRKAGFGVWINFRDYGQFGLYSPAADAACADFGPALLVDGRLHVPAAAGPAPGPPPGPGDVFVVHGGWRILRASGTGRGPSVSFLERFGPRLIPLLPFRGILGDAVRRAALAPAAADVPTGWRRRIAVSDDFVEVRDTMALPRPGGTVAVRFLPDAGPSRHPAGSFGTCRFSVTPAVLDGGSALDVASELRSRGRATLVTRWTLRTHGWDVRREVSEADP